MLSDAQWVAVVMVLGTIIATLIGKLFDHRSAGAQVRQNDGAAADNISAAWERLNKPLLERIASLEEENEALLARVAALEVFQRQAAAYRAALIRHKIQVPAVE